MTNRSKAVGTSAESAVVRAARAHGFPHAERVVLHGNLDQGDVRLTPGLTAGCIVEVKGGQAAKTASDGQIEKWLAETERERVNAGADVAILVTARAGIGAPNAHRWWAHWRLSSLVWLQERHVYIPTALTDAPVRLTLAHSLTLLRHAGYGDTPTPETP